VNPSRQPVASNTASTVRHLPVLADDDLVGFLSVRAVVEALAARG
jgi:hypothetical protein